MLIVNVAVVPLAPIRSAGAPVAVNEILVHEITAVFRAVVMRLVVQVGLCCCTVIVPEVPNTHPLRVTVAPPLEPVMLYEFAAVGVDDEIVKLQPVVMFCAVAPVVVQPPLLLHAENTRVEKGAELLPVVTETVAVEVQVTVRLPTENTAVPDTWTEHGDAAGAHVGLAAAGDTDADSATSATIRPRAPTLPNRFMLLDLSLAHACASNCLKRHA